MIEEIIKKEIKEGSVIPKPKPKGKFKVKGWGKRRGEDALIYTIPNHRNPERPYEKGITITEFSRAYSQLKSSGEITRQWFNKHLSECAKEGGCNFTTIGGIFEIIGIVKYESKGVYKATET
jgi:hypothetical protein